jgi:arginine/ornithine N-succinyltransferase beta subunit
MMSDVMLQAGVSYYFTTNTLEEVKGVSATGINSPYWAWVMITFTPQLFSTK